MPNAPARSAGFTALEVIIVVFISSLLLTALLRFLSIGHPLARVTYLQARSTETARVQLRRLAKALRELRPSDDGSYPLAETSPQKIIFYSNIDADPATERVRYELTGTDLKRGVLEPTGDPIVYDEANEKETVVARNVRNGTAAVFTYYTGDYPADTTPLTPTDLTEVKYIQFYLVIDIDPDIDPPPLPILSQVQLRNLKTNLAETVE